MTRRTRARRAGDIARAVVVPVPVVPPRRVFSDVDTQRTAALAAALALARIGRRGSIERALARRAFDATARAAAARDATRVLTAIDSGAATTMRTVRDALTATDIVDA